MSNAIEPLSRPKLSDLGFDLLSLTQWQRIRAIAWPLGSFVAYWIFACWEHWLLAVLSLMVLSFVTYGSTSHDLVHGNLGLKRRTNDFILAIIELLSLRSGHAYEVAHLNHHAKFPHNDDIEAKAAQMSLVRALLEGPIFQFRVYAWSFQNPRGRRNWIIAEGIGVVALVFAAIAALPWTIIPAVYAGLMISGSWTIPLITAYLPHVAEAKDALHQTRRFRGTVFRCVAFDHLYHLEHHLYPAVPHQNWPLLAQRLDPWLDAAGVKPVRIG